MIYDILSETFEFYLIEHMKFEKKWNKRHPELRPDNRLSSYIQMMNDN
jgi:hypothetical protein